MRRFTFTLVSLLADRKSSQCWVIEAEDQARKIKTKKVRVYFDTAHVLRTLEDCANNSVRQEGAADGVKSAGIASI
jgi:hypothetical protein